jgi:hypothetical protein
VAVGGRGEDCGYSEDESEVRGTREGCTVGLVCTDTLGLCLF